MAAFDGYTAAEILTQVRSILAEPTALYWTADEINKWVQEAAMDIATKVLGYEKSDYITLSTSAPELTYGAMQGGDSIDGMVKIYGAVYYNTAETHRGLMKIHPRQIEHLPEQTAGEPYYWWHFGDEFGLYPVASSAIVTAGGKVKVYYSMLDETITNLPWHYRLPAIYYAVAMARKKQGMIAESNQFYAMYMNSLAFYRADLYERGVDSKDMFEIPDGTRVVGR